MFARFIYGVRTENDVNRLLIIIQRIRLFAERNAPLRSNYRTFRIGLNSNANTEQ